MCLCKNSYFKFLCSNFQPYLKSLKAKDAYYSWTIFVPNNHLYKTTPLATIPCLHFSFAWLRFCSFSQMSWAARQATLSENPVMWEKQKKGWGMSCGIGEAMEGLENEL